MFPFAELVENYFIDEEQDSLNREAENPVEVLMKTYYSQSYSECSDDNPLATDIRNSFIWNFRNPNDQYEYEDESEDEWDGVGSCVDDGCPLCWPNHVCSPRKVPSNLTDSVIRLVNSVYKSFDSKISISRFEVYFLAEKVKQLTKFSPQQWRFWKTKAEGSLNRLSEFCEKVCDTLSLEMKIEFCKLSGLPNVVSNMIVDMLLEESIRKDNETMVKFEELPVTNKVTRKILVDVFGYLAKTWISIVRKIEYFPCFCYHPYLTGFNEVHVPDDIMAGWRNYFGLTEELQWYNLFDEDDDNTNPVDALEEPTVDEDDRKG